MKPATSQEGAGPRTIRNIRSAAGKTNASRTLTRCGVLWGFAANVAVRDRAVVEAGRNDPLPVPEPAAPEDGDAAEPLDEGGVAVPDAGAGAAPTLIVVVGWAARGAEGGAGRVVAGGCVAGGRRTGGGVGMGAVDPGIVGTVGVGTVGVGTVGVGTVGVGAVGVGAVGVGTDGTGTGVVGTVGTGTVGTVTLTVGTGGTIAFPAWTSTCADTRPPIATISPTSRPNHFIRRRPPDRGVCNYNASTLQRGAASIEAVSASSVGATGSGDLVLPGMVVPGVVVACVVVLCVGVRRIRRASREHRLELVHERHRRLPSRGEERS